jgi:GT2 family glycosyltransferase
VGVLVSVIIPVFNGAELLWEQLDALAGQQFAGTWEVIIADNGSTDAETATAFAHFATVLALTVIDASGRRGAAHARNVGAAHANGELLAFCDSDDVVEPDWLQNLVAQAQDHDLVAGALDFETLNAGIPLPEYWKRPPVALARKLGFLPSGPAGNLLVRRDAFDRLGGFTEGFGACEDVDFYWRAQLAGLRVGYAASAQIGCRLRPGTWQRMERRYFYAKSEAHLYREFRARGMPRDSLRRVVKDWIRNLALLPVVMFSQQSRQVVEERLPYRIGRLVGSVRWRVVFL